MRNPFSVLLRALPATLLAGLVLAAQGPAAPVPKPKLEFEKYRLANGLEVILAEDHRLPLLAVNLWYHVGPANEKAGRTGFAHLFEHMMFQGSKNVPEHGHLQLLEGAGASDLNGTTGFDRTNYFETLPSNQLELALWLESDRMGFLLEKLDHAKLENQRDVVRNERRQSIEGAPYGIVEEAVFHALFPPGHPYYASVIGSHADIEAARLPDVREFFSQYYAPNNASLAIVGDIDRTRVKAMVEKYFGPLPRGPSVEKPAVKTPPLTEEKRLTVTDKVELPRVYVAWLSPAIFQPGDADADVLGLILGGSKSSRLYQKLVYEQQIAQDVTASQQSLQLGSVFQIEATARPGVKPEALLAAIDAEIAAVRDRGATAAEVDRARNTIVADIVRGLETLGGFGGVADRLNQYNHYLGDPGWLPNDLARYDAVTPASVQALAVSTLKADARVVVFGVPGNKVLDDPARATRAADEAAPASTVAGWRATMPKPGPASSLRLPVPQRFVLPNGLTVLLMESHRLPVVAANLVVLAGSERNPADRPGLAAFTADLLDEGTTQRDSLQISQELGALGSTLATSSTTDFSSVALRSLTTTVDPAFALMAEVVQRPAFSAAEIERVRASRLVQFQQQRDNPAAIAARVFNAELYGTGHPYGYTELGTQDALQKTTRDDLVAFWKAGFTPANSALIVAGDLDAAGLRALAEKHFGAWQGSRPPAVALSTPKSAGRRIVVVDRGASPQTAMRLGSVGVTRASPDYVPLEVMNGTLGGLFSSRINLNLRERNGYTYGARSGFGYRRGPGPFVIQTSVRADVTAPAVREVLNEVQMLRDAPVTAAELRLSKDSFALSLPGQFETSGDAAASAAQLFVYDLPLDYYRTLSGRIDAVTAADVQRVARSAVDPARLLVVAVGDRASIEPELRKLGIGAVESRAAGLMTAADRKPGSLLTLARPVTLRQRAILFAVLLLLPAIAVGAYLVASTYQRERVVLNGTLRDTTRALSLVVDREFERRAAIVRLLAASAALQRWDLEAFDREARAAVFGSGAQIAVYDREHQYVNTRLPFGSALGSARSLPVQLADSQLLVSDLFTGAASNQPQMVMNVGVRIRGRLLNVSMSVLPEELQPIIEQQRLPDSWTAAIVNRQGRLIARAPDPERWVGVSATDDLLRELGQGSEGFFETVSLDGVRSTAFFSRSAQFGTTFAIGVPREELMRGLRHSIRDVVIGATMLLMLGLAISLWAASRLLRPVRVLGSAAADLEAGRSVTVPRTGIWEYDVVGDALARASEHIRAANSALEARVAEAVAEVEATQARLAQSQKLEAVGRLTGGVAHDFNNLLQTLSTGLHVLDRLVHEARAKPLIAAGLRAVDRAAQLVQQMLSFSRRQPLKRQVIDFRNQLLSMEPLLSRALPAHMTLHTKISPDLWTIETDPAQLEVALLNLLFNARDAVGKEGTIEISARNAPAEEQVIIQVRDNGSGISPEDIERVFEPFFTTKPVGQGTGLGLAQVHAFATESGGSVAIESEPGHGTTIGIRLPRAVADIVEEHAALPPARLEGSCRLLFVEDDPLVAEVVSSALQGTGFEVLRARTADDALAIVRGGHSFDLVFSDIVMPGTLSGIELAEVLHAEQPSLPVVLASGYSERAPPQFSIVVLAKPYSIETLVRTLIDALRGAKLH